MDEHVLTRISEVDERDYPISTLLTEAPLIDEKFWWDNGWWGDQGNTFECTAYSWTHWVEDSILNQDLFAKVAGPLWNVELFYNKLRLNDGIPGANYNGSTVRAGAKVLKELGVITEYRWAKTIDEMVNCLLTVGPMVVGTTWYASMFTPDSNFMVKPVGRTSGGHAYVINGVNKTKKLFRIKNSWGKTWGDGGHAYISFDDFATLLNHGGDACIAINAKMNSVPDINTVPDSDTLPQ